MIVWESLLTFLGLHFFFMGKIEIPVPTHGFVVFSLLNELITHKAFRTVLGSKCMCAVFLFKIT